MVKLTAFQAVAMGSSPIIRKNDYFFGTSFQTNANKLTKFIKVLKRTSEEEITHSV